MFVSNPLRLISRHCGLGAGIGAGFRSQAAGFGPQLRHFSFKTPVSAHLRATAAKTTRPASRSVVSRSLQLLVGTTVSGAVLMRSGGPLANDVAHLPGQDLAHNVAVNTVYSDNGDVKSRFGGAVNYEELTIGSVTGLFLGVIAGKLSSVFVFLALSSYFLIQFLESRNIINIPWSSIVSVGRQKVDLKQLVLHKPSFKFSFSLAFLIAAYNI